MSRRPVYSSTDDFGWTMSIQVLTAMWTQMNPHHPKPPTPATQPWSSTLWAPWGARCSSSRAGRDRSKHDNPTLQWPFMDLWSVEFSFTVWLSLLLYFSFFWRKHLQNPRAQQSLISSFWPNAPEKVDAAFESHQTDQVYLFKGTSSSSTAMICYCLAEKW